MSGAAFLSSKAAPNPSLLIVDTDALLQLLIAGEVRILLYLKRTFGVQAAITESVEMEIRRKPEFRARFSKDLDKALDNGALLVLEARNLPPFVTTDPNSVYGAIQTKGGMLARSGMDYGEAYTYAAGIVLNAPVVSNDMNAIKTARKKGLQLPGLIARVFDLVALCRQAEHLNDSDCDRIRDTLYHANEFLPAAFQHQSFASGLKEFYPRLCDATVPAIGSPSPIHDLDTRMLLSRATRQPSS